MAEAFDQQQKTEAPTQCRREEVRSEGHVAVSSELTAGLLLTAGMLVLALYGPALAQNLLSVVRHYLMNSGTRNLDFDRSQSLLAEFVSHGGRLLGIPFGILVAAAAAVGFAQVGFYVVPTLIAPKWDRISFASGWTRVFSMAGVVRGAISLCKAVVVALVAFWVLKGKAAQVTCFGDAGLAATVGAGWSIAIRVALGIAVTLAFIGLADYLFQWWRHEQSLRMTRQELKDELRREEGDPQLRARIRKMQREMSKRRMLQDVPRATFVVTNPTHLAVALRYERGKMGAPRVIAKGAGDVAKRIVELARRHAVPVVERKLLARALFKSVQLGQEIPAALYQLVAELLAYIYRIRNVNVMG